MGTNQFWNAHSSTMFLQIDGLNFSSYFHHYPITSWIPMKITSSSSPAVVPFDLNGRGERVWSQRRWIFGSLGVQDSFFDAGSCGHRNANFRILKWRYCTICLSIFCGDIPLHRPLKKALIIYGRYLQFRFLKWPLNIAMRKNVVLMGMYQNLCNIFLADEHQGVDSYPHCCRCVVIYVVFCCSFYWFLVSWSYPICLGHIPYIPLQFFFLIQIVSCWESPGAHSWTFG